MEKLLQENGVQADTTIVRTRINNERRKLDTKSADRKRKLNM